MNCSKWVLPLCKTHSNILPTDKMFDTMWNRDDAVLQSTLGFMLPAKAEDSLLLYYRQYSRLFFFLFTATCFFFSLSRIKTHFSTYLSSICHKHSHGDLGAHHFFHRAVLAQPDWPWFHSLRQTLSAKSAPLKRPFCLCLLASVKGSLCVFQ